MKNYTVELQERGFDGCHSDHPAFSENLITDVICEFAEQGFEVSRAALLHNFEAWQSDQKSGYRDEQNGVFVFSPCGCNPLRFYVEELDENITYQKTYTC